MHISLVDYIPDVLQFIFVLATIIVPFMLWTSFRASWKKYNILKSLNKQTPVILEIMLPKQIDKTPSAMESFLINLHQTGGSTRPWFSLEMASIEGKVRFFIWTWASWRRFLETQLYAQYPGIEVSEAKDYAKAITYNPQVNNLWGCEMKLTKPDAYPIKTYKDYGIGDDTSKEEEVKVDPITPTIEFLGSVGARQQIWVQFLIRAHQAEKEAPFGEQLAKFWDSWKKNNFNKALEEFSKKSDSWKDSAVSEIKKLREEASPKIKNADGTESLGAPSFTKGQIEVINSLERSIAKPGFDVGIRTLYIAENEYYDPTYIGGLTSVFKQYGSHNLNGFAPKGATAFEYPWQDFTGKNLIKKKSKFLTAYKARGYFYGDFASASMILNSEELATVYHFPGQVVQTPSFERVMSKKAEPPGNLPI